MLLTHGRAGSLGSLGAALGLLFASVPVLPAQTTFFVVRHADRGASEPDPPLTDAGKKRAETLGAILRDAHVTHIYTTELVRTGQTAAPTARIAGVTPEVVKQTDFGTLMARLRSHSAPGEAVLVVGHRGTVPRIVKALTGMEITPLGSAEYDRLVAVTIFPDGKASVITLRYGDRDEGQ